MYLYKINNIQKRTFTVEPSLLINLYLSNFRYLVQADKPSKENEETIYSWLSRTKKKKGIKASGYIKTVSLHL